MAAAMLPQEAPPRSSPGAISDLGGSGETSMEAWSWLPWKTDWISSNRVLALCGGVAREGGGGASVVRWSFCVGRGSGGVQRERRRLGGRRRRRGEKVCRGVRWNWMGP
jgi:hypothetical protein